MTTDTLIQTIGIAGIRFVDHGPEWELLVSAVADGLVCAKVNVLSVAFGGEDAKSTRYVLTQRGLDRLHELNAPIDDEHIAEGGEFPHIEHTEETMDAVGAAQVEPIGTEPTPNPADPSTLLDENAAAPVDDDQVGLVSSEPPVVAAPTSSPDPEEAWADVFAYLMTRQEDATTIAEFYGGRARADDTGARDALAQAGSKLFKDHTLTVPEIKLKAIRLGVIARGLGLTAHTAPRKPIRFVRAAVRKWAMNPTTIQLQHVDEDDDHPKVWPR